MRRANCSDRFIWSPWQPRLATKAGNQGKGIARSAGSMTNEAVAIADWAPKAPGEETLRMGAGASARSRRRALHYFGCAEDSRTCSSGS
jgi:hypothetical protein